MVHDKTLDEITAAEDGDDGPLTANDAPRDDGMSN